jgi:hypothetical protein
MICRFQMPIVGTSTPQLPAGAGTLTKPQSLATPISLSILLTGYLNNYPNVFATISIVSLLARCDSGLVGVSIDKFTFFF